MTISELSTKTMNQAKAKGFGVTPEEVNIPEKFALIHTEISEAYDAYRKNNFDDRHGVKEELADTLTRVFHLCGILNIDIEAALQKKFEVNKDRVWNWNEMNESHQ